MTTADYPYYQCSFAEFNKAQSAVVPFLDKDNNLVISLQTAVGKCVGRSARVCLADGTYVPIGDLYDRGCKQVEVLSVDNTLKVVEANATLIKLDGKRTRMVELRTGEKLDVTEEHPFLVRRDDGIQWVRAEDLHIGDFVAIVSRFPEGKGGEFDILDCLCVVDAYVKCPILLRKALVLGNGSEYGSRCWGAAFLGVKDYQVRNWEEGKKMPAKFLAKLVSAGFCDLPSDLMLYGSNSEMSMRIPKITNEFAWLLGLVIADGHIHLGRTGNWMTISSGEDVVLELAKKVFFDEFGIVSKIERDGRCSVLRVSSRVLAEFFVWLGIPVGKKSDIVSVPSIILRQDNSIVSAFLRGLFDGKGCGGRNVEYETNSEMLAFQVQMLLRRFSIVSSRRAQKASYRVFICSQDAVSFVERIGFTTNHSSNQTLSQICDTDLRFVPVVRLEHSEEECVYDLVVPGNRNFVAEGVILHNTAMAECAFGYHLSTSTDSKVVYACPYKSISSERYKSWMDDEQFEPHGILLNTSDVAYVSLEDYEKSRIIIMTSEALDSKLRSSSHRAWLRKVACFCFDEAHLIGQARRGGSVEAALMRLTHINPTARLILLSATMTNAVQLAKWLKSLNGKQTKCIKSDWRPVDIEMRYHAYDDEKADIAKEEKLDKVVELIANRSYGDKVLVFVHSKKFGGELVKLFRSRGVMSAFHNASLSFLKREKIERAFDNPLSGLDVLVSTSTLSSGVNIG